MSPSDIAIFSVIATVPIAVVLIIALLRGYTISLHMTRNDKKNDRGN
jgi:hypothetical protein